VLWALVIRTLNEPTTRSVAKPSATSEEPTS
jgi:hypothetical protein